MHRHPLRSFGRAVALAALAVLLAACSEQEIYSQLSERQANEMVAVLRSAGIDADKKVQDGKLRLVLLRGLGQAVVSDVATDEQIVAAIEVRCTKMGSF